MSAPLRLLRPSLLRCAIAVAVLGAVPAGAQTPGVNEMALEWARGRYASPVLCEIDGEPISGVRRLMITPGARHATPPVDRILFSDLEADTATRCFDPFGGVQENLRGTLEFRLDRRSRPDLAQREFSTALRRDRGFDFLVTKGTLRISAVGPEAVARDIDFRGGRASLHAVEKGSDTERLLSPYPALRRMVLEIESRDGSETLRLPLFMTAPR